MSNDSKYSLSRRKALLGLGTVGVAGAGAGVGTSALFSDTESFEDNTLTAGELDLIVDYGTSVDDPTNASASDVIDGGQANNGEIQGDVSAEYVLNDVKPGDGGFLAFCPKIVDNPAYLYVGSNGLIDYENGYTEPESSAGDESDEISDRDGGDSYTDFPVDDDNLSGAGFGELSEAIEVTVELCDYTGGEDGDRGDPENYETNRELDNPDDYTLADLAADLMGEGYLIGDPYPASPDQDTQAGDCFCIKWEIPTDVGNEIQSDSLEFDVSFAAIQERNNPNPTSPFGVDSDDRLTSLLGDGVDPIGFQQSYLNGLDSPEQGNAVTVGGTDFFEARFDPPAISELPTAGVGNEDPVGRLDVVSLDDGSAYTLNAIEANDTIGSGEGGPGNVKGFISAPDTGEYVVAVTVDDETTDPTPDDASSSTYVYLVDTST